MDFLARLQAFGPADEVGVKSGVRVYGTEERIHDSAANEEEIVFIDFNAPVLTLVRDKSSVPFP